MYKNNDFKIEPRSTLDVVLGPPKLAGFEPAFTFLREGTTGVTTIPTPLQVRLSNIWTADTVVTVSSGSSVVNVDNTGQVTVPAGQLTAPVLLDGVSSTDGGSVTLNAQMGGTMLTAQVRVLGANETPSLISFTPSVAAAVQGGTATLTCSLRFSRCDGRRPMCDAGGGPVDRFRDGACDGREGGAAEPDRAHGARPVTLDLERGRCRWARIFATLGATHVDQRRRCYAQLRRRPATSPSAKSLLERAAERVTSSGRS